MAFEAIAAAGWIPAVILAGRGLAARAGVDRPVDRWVLAPAVGLALWTLPMLLAGAFDLYRPWLFGLAGWLLTVALGRRISWRNELGCVRLSGSGWFVIVLTVCFAGLSLVFASESFLGGRDQGGYANHALHIARTGSVWIAFPFESFGEARFGPLHFLQNLSNLSFMPSHMEGQFPPVYTIWMAQTAAVFGRMGVLGFNPVLAALTIPLVYRLGRQFLNRPSALVALTVFALNPAQLWLARVTLSEISAQHMVAAALLFLVLGWSSRRTTIAAMGALLLGAAFWIRIDGAIFAPALALAFAALLIWGRRGVDEGPSDLRLMATVGWVLALLFLAGGLFYFVFTRQYFLSLSPIWLRLGGLAIVLTLGAAVFYNRKLSGRVAQGLDNRILSGIVLGALVGLLLWAYWIRPVTEPFDFIRGDPENGRSFREDSLVNLVAYISVPAACLGMIGLVGTVWALLRRRLPMAWILPLGVWGVFAAIYLYNQSIYPDHPWAIRRFVPVIIPGCALLAGFGFQGISGAARFGRHGTWIGAAVCLVLALVLGSKSSAFLYLKENRGTVDWIDTIDGIVRPGSLIFADTGTLFFDPLYPGQGLRIVRINLGDARMPDLIGTVIRENVAEGDPVYYLTQHPWDHLIQAEEIHRIPFAYDFIAPTTRPPAKEIGHHAYQLNLYASVLAPRDPKGGYGNVTIGYTPVAGVEEHGFYGSESSSNGPFRWTDGNARLKVPLRDGYRPRSIILEIGDAPPDGSDLVLLANGIEFYRESLVPPVGRVEVDLPTEWEGGHLDLEIRSGFFVPAEIAGRGSDQRRLGLCLYGVTLSDQYATKGTFALGTVPVAGVAEAGFHGPETNEAGPYRWTDGAARLDVPLPADYRLERIDLNILDIPPDGTEVDIRLNGTSVYREWFAETPGVIQVPVDTIEPVPEASTLRLELLSGSFRPSDLNGGSDERILGLRIHGITVSDRR